MLAALSFASVLAISLASYVAVSYSTLARVDERVTSASKLLAGENVLEETLYRVSSSDLAGWSIDGPTASQTVTGLSLPQIVSLDMIESFQGEIVVRGTLEASSEQASRLIGNYVKGLIDNPIIGPHFDEIKLSGLERFDDEEGLSFEFTMTPKTGDEDV